MLGEIDLRKIIAILTLLIITGISEPSYGATVTFFGWGGDSRVNAWFDGYVSKELFGRYGIKLKRVPMNIDDILRRLSSEKKSGAKRGSADIIWINGENFYAAKREGLLFGPFLKNLPEIGRTIQLSPEVLSDFGVPTEGYEAPFGRAQLVLFADSALISELPDTPEKLLKTAMLNPGKITYPAPPDFTGSAFVRSIIASFIGKDKMGELPADKKQLEKITAPAFAFLKKLSPYLWMKGKSYPSSVAQLSALYADKEVLMGMSYSPFYASGRVAAGDFPKTTRSFVLNTGTMGNTHFLAIAFNAQNPDAAQVVINFLLSPEAQLSKYAPSVWGDMPVTSMSLLDANMRGRFNRTDIGKASLKAEELERKRIPEPKAEVVSMIEKLWGEKVLKD